jgi:two-component system CheB/CheR fusion protein
MSATPIAGKKKPLPPKGDTGKTIAKKSSPPKAQQTTSATRKEMTSVSPEPGSAASSFPVVAIGASAGGLEAVMELLKNLSPTTGMAFIYVQHLSPDHKSILSTLLARATKMAVQVIDDMEQMKPDNVYVIPYNRDIEVTDGHIKLIPRVHKTSNLSIDVLFSSLAETHKENVVGIVLSGSASDGTRGLKEIKMAGGITFAQDDSAKFGSMPQSAIASGVVDFVLSPRAIAKELNRISKYPLTGRKALKPQQDAEIENSNPDLQNILQLLSNRKNVDFSHYKMTTIKRRMLRRMQIHSIKTLKKYGALLSKDANELDLLYSDLLINVTEFFRDTDAFLHLYKTELPRLLKSKARGETLRIWVSACATGEEVYSIAMMILELQKNKNNTIPFQIFASDLSAEAISTARIGEYSLQQLKNVSAKRIQQFFTKTKDHYRISKSLRDVCVFALHNVLQDPPFSRMDFISCRNLLIYLDAFAQKKVLSTFHFALKDGGTLMLGKSETIGTSTQFFTPLNKKFKTYSCKKKEENNRIPDLIPTLSQNSLLQSGNTYTTPKKTATATTNLGSTFDSILLSRYMPASVIINHEMEILEFRGATKTYLNHTSGRASFNILKMAHLEITFELRNVIHNAIKTKQIVRKTGIEINHDKPGFILRIVNLEVAPLQIDGEGPLLIVVFTGQELDEAEPSVAGGKSNSIAKDRRIKKLEEELAVARFDMGSITDDQEAANEELQSANEEIISSNEELQSLNEELETSKEEIESTNEELTTSNQELHGRIQQIEDLSTYYEIILDTVHEPVLILDKNIRIKSANKSFCRIFHVPEEECLGVSLYKLGDNQWNIPRLRELLEDIVPKNNRFHDLEIELDFPVIGPKTLLLNAHRIIQPSRNEELIVLTIIDITDVRKLAIELQLKEKKKLEILLETGKTSLKTVEDSNKRYNMLLMQSIFAFAILKGKEKTIVLANNSIKEIWGKGDDVVGKRLLKVLPELKRTGVPALMDEVFTTGIPYNGYEVLVPLNRNGKMEDAYFNFVYQPYLEADETISGISIISYEVTEHVIAKNELVVAKGKAEHRREIAEDAVKSKQQLLANMSHEIRTPMNAIVGFTNVILKTRLDESQREYINAIKTSGDALLILVDDILDLAKVDAGKMTFEHTPFNLSASVSMVLHLFESKIREKNLKLIAEYDKAIPEMLIGDSLRLRQILLNLLSNAVKFTAAGTIQISIAIKTQDGEDLSIEFKVTDTGIGVPANKLETIFNDFEQAGRETSSAYGGTGLGLAIVKRLVELQGGTISLTSKLGRGSVFSFVLSFKKALPDNFSIVPETGSPADTKPETRKIRVLVAEDVALNQMLIKIILLEFGFEIDIAPNGLAVIEKLQSGSYDVVLMDLQMPEMNGFDSTAYIRNQLNSSVPIIALTADVTAADVKKCSEVGMDDYISKPIDEKLLYNKIMSCIARVRG